MKLLKKHGNSVFVHSLWRTANTYFLGKFSGLDETMVFAEPFNYQLSIVDESICAASEDDGVGLSAYRGLVDARSKIGGVGIQFYDIRYALNFWFDHKDHGQLRYIQSLIDYAADRDKAAVLGFVRSLGRLPLLREMSGVHIMLMRDPFDLFWSNYLKLRDEDTSFFALQYVMLATLCREVPALEALAMKHNLPKLKIKGAHDTFTEAYAQMRSICSDNIELLRESFILVYLLSYGAAMTHADLVINVDRLSVDAAYQARLSELIADRTGHELDFSDCACTRYAEPGPRMEFYETYRAEQCTLEDSKQARWLSGGRLIDSLLA
ncbi:hypothetical protein [Cerasicoccus frondis]|uniref:hypothetical protein n=1 Tax=Cerasicoccus frondis TaxID=490090 RepID=UPI00285279A7|nr:hypothetical protein [Cerasicoccus frondis]